MNNKPVAWAREDGVIAFHKKPEVDSQGFKWYALYTYTHPADEKQSKFKPNNQVNLDLTDEEIIEIWGVKSIWDDKLIEFARAILIKAQEK